MRALVEKLWSLAPADRFAHRCILLEKVCLFNGSVFAIGAAAGSLAAKESARLRVRHPNRAHDVLTVAEWWPSLVHPPPPDSSTFAAISRTVARQGFSNCTPLVWLPTWPDNFAEGFVNSLVPLQELMTLGVIGQQTPLRPDIGGNPRFPIARLLQRLSSQKLRILREAAPSCVNQNDGACRAECYKELLVCRLRTAFDGAPEPATPWHMAQRLAALVPRAPDAPTAAAPRYDWHVLFVNRSNSLFGGRRLVNLRELLHRCANAWPGMVRCSVRTFGLDTDEDIRTARTADILVGMHGAGMFNAFFMPRRSAVLEVRPFRFEGAWPDRFVKLWTAKDQCILYFQISTASPKLCKLGADAEPSMLTAWQLDVFLPWRTLSMALQAIFSLNRSVEAYERLPTTTFLSFHQEGDIGHHFRWPARRMRRKTAGGWPEVVDDPEHTYIFSSSSSSTTSDADAQPSQ